MDTDFWTGLITVVLIVLAYRHFKSKKNNQTKTKKKGALDAFMEGFNSTSGKKVSKKNEDYEEVDYESNASKKKGGLASFLAGGIVANKITQRLNPPTVIFEDPDYVVMGIIPKTATTWTLKIGKKDSKNRVSHYTNYTISKYTSSISTGRGKIYHNN